MDNFTLQAILRLLICQNYKQTIKHSNKEQTSKQNTANKLQDTYATGSRLFMVNEIVS